MDDKTPRQAIVVGIDGSDLSVDALKWALRQAAATGADVEAVTSWEVPMSVLILPTATEEDYQRHAQTTLDRAVEATSASAPQVTIHQHLVQKRAGYALTHAAEGAQLLVVGSHGHGEFPGMHLGSTATYCVHHAPCPVLVFRGQHTGR